MYENSVFEQLALWNTHDAQPEKTISSGKERGAVYTRPETVDFILNLVGYLPDKPLYHYTLLEPSFGSGGFLVRAVERLLQSYPERYNILCKRLMQEKLYSSSAFLLSPRNGVETGECSELSEMTSIRTFFAGFAARVAVEAAR